MKPGAFPTSRGVEYCVWSPESREVTVAVEAGPERRSVALQKSSGGYHTGADPAGQPGDAYGFQLDGGRILPDPASRAQRDDVHGLSLVVDPGVFVWKDENWRRPPFRDLVIYELHLGTFTPPGTFLAAIEKLPHLAQLGITALEIMPIGDFPGSRNWGYDGTLIYAPARCYGTPDDFRALIDSAHRHGLAVILDVVYNHFGPDGNYLTAYSPRYFRAHSTPWGKGFNFDAEGCEDVRRFFVANPVYWMEDFHIDGFRFDATHEITDTSPIHILAEMTTVVRERGGYSIAEDARNEASVISREGLGFDAVWADDLHHVLRVSQTGERYSYFGDFAGTPEEAACVLVHGWLYRGQFSPSFGRPRGTECRHLAPQHFVHCLSNHDQTGNHAKGLRMNQVITPEAYRAFSMLLCLNPYTPMLFMGQEWGANTPFMFFTDHNEELGKLITAGRRKEFAHFPEFADARNVPDPQAPQTFQDSKLHWEEIDQKPHHDLLALYSACLKIRAENRIFRPEDRDSWKVTLAPGSPTLLLSWTDWLLVVHLMKSGAVEMRGGFQMVLSSEEKRFGGRGELTRGDLRSLRFQGPEAVLLRRPMRAPHVPPSICD